MLLYEESTLFYVIFLLGKSDCLFRFFLFVLVRWDWLRIIELVDTLDKRGKIDCDCQESTENGSDPVDPVVVCERAHDQRRSEGSGRVQTATCVRSHEEHACQNHEAGRSGGEPLKRVKLSVHERSLDSYIVR